MKGFRVWVLALLAALIAFSPLFYAAYNYNSATPETGVVSTVQFAPPRPTTLQVGTRYNVLAANVMDGYKFGLFLEGDMWIEAQLAVATHETATLKVVEWLKAPAPQPTVVLRRKVGNYWIVDFEISKDGKRSNLVELLGAEELLLN